MSLLSLPNSQRVKETKKQQRRRQTRRTMFEALLPREMMAADLIDISHPSLTDGVVDEFNLEEVSEIAVNADGGDDLVDLHGVTIPSVIHGNAGSDELIRGLANDQVHVDTDNDVLRGGAGNNQLTGVPEIRHDVNGDEFVSAIDAIHATSQLNGRPLTSTAPRNPFDVDGSGTVTRADAILILEDITAHGPRQLNSLKHLRCVAAYLDVNGDGFVSSADALQVVNHLNEEARQKTIARSEGEITPLVFNVSSFQDSVTEGQAASFEIEVAPYSTDISYLVTTSIGPLICEDCATNDVDFESFAHQFLFRADDFHRRREFSIQTFRDNVAEANDVIRLQVSPLVPVGTIDIPTFLFLVSINDRT